MKTRRKKVTLLPKSATDWCCQWLWLWSLTATCFQHDFLISGPSAKIKKKRMRHWSMIKITRVGFHSVLCFYKEQFFNKDRTTSGSSMEMTIVVMSWKRILCGDQEIRYSVKHPFWLFASQLLKQTPKELQGCCFDLHLCQTQLRTRHRALSDPRHFERSCGNHPP